MRKRIVNFALYTENSQAKLSSFSTSSKVEELIIPLSAKTTEIRWPLKVVISLGLLRSCLYISNLFKAIFPENEISLKFQMSKINCAHAINYGIPPDFKEIYKDKQSSQFCSVIFDESLNRMLQEERMDIQIRYWIACTRYFDSQFLHRPNAKI